MRRVRRFATLFALVAVLGGALAPAAEAGSKKCSPGQHGNPHPGYKPGSCDN